MKKRIHLIVSGRVQGVCFRMDTCSEAQRLGLTGWVRNMPSGDVEVLAEGDEGSLARLRAWCRKGPPMAFVTGLDESTSTATGEFDFFRITF